MNKTLAQQPTVISRADHTVSRTKISPNALKVLYRLRSAGYQACLVGGSVRDLLLDRTPKDFDVGTDAHPEEVYKLFRNCRLIGRRFRLAHIHFSGEIIEVATFRGQTNADEDSDNEDALRGANGLIISDNVYGSIEEDALRRDFTINALYYDVDDFTVLDYVGGITDLEEGLIRLIGDPEQRYREDPVRMLRAIRFAAKLGFRLHPDTEAPIHQLVDLLTHVPPARLFDELLKLFLGGHAQQTYELLRLYGLFGQLLPLTERCLHSHNQLTYRNLLKRACFNTDQRIAADKPVTPAFLFAVLLWPPLQERIARLTDNGLSPREALHSAAIEMIQRQSEHTALPRRFSTPMQEIWSLQDRFNQRTSKRAMRFIQHVRFRAAYDFLLLRAEAGEDLKELGQWWTQFQELDTTGQEQMLRSINKRKKPPSAKRRSRYQRATISAH